MKVLAFAYACEPDKGSEPGVGWGWARVLAGLGEVWVITRANNRSSIEDALQDVPERETLHFIYVDPPPWLTFWKKGSRGVRLFYFFWQLAAARRAIELHRQMDFDVVWHLTLANAWLGSASILVGPPVIFGPVGGGVSCPPNLWIALGAKGLIFEIMRHAGRLASRYLNPLVRLTWRRAAIILTQNSETSRWLPRPYRRKATIFPHAILRGDRALVSKPSRSEQRTAIFVGRLVPWKGATLAIEAIKAAPSWRLEICGSGPDRKRLERLVARLVVSDRVLFLGQLPQRELFERMRLSDVLLFPSCHDDSPLTVVECLNFGLPVLCLRIGGPPVLVGKAGVAVDPLGSKAEIVDNLARTLEKGSLPSKSIALARGAEFSVEGTRERLRRFLDSEMPALLVSAITESRER